MEKTVANGASERSAEFRNRRCVREPAGGRETSPGTRELYCAYYSEVGRTVCSTLRSGIRADYDDVCQIVFKKVVEALHEGKIDGSSDLRAYIRKVARNSALDWRRRRGRETLVGDASELTIVVPQSVIEYDVALAMLERYLLTLTGQISALYQFRFVRRYSQARAAYELGISRQKLRTLEKRLKQELRQSMADVGLTWD